MENERFSVSLKEIALCSLCSGRPDADRALLSLINMSGIGLNRTNDIIDRI